jgi:hypothetical protein
MRAVRVRGVQHPDCQARGGEPTVPVSAAQGFAAVTAGRYAVGRSACQWQCPLIILR